MSAVESEFRAYPYIQERLKEMGWNTKSPKHGGQVYTQNEAVAQNTKLKEALGKGKPEYVVAICENDFWVIEAKVRIEDLPSALEDARKRAKQINAVTGIKCQLITGFAGTPDSTHYVETHCLVDGEWKRLEINKRRSTGFISPDQAGQVLDGGQGRLDDYDIDDKLFSNKIEEINDIFHNGAFHKRNRAAVLACLLLSLANDHQMPLNQNPTTLINDINTRVKAELRKHGQEAFYNEIEINKPASPDNHTKNRNALALSMGILRDLNIASTISSGRDILGQCYEQFLKYASDAKEIGIVLTPRHITNFGAQAININRDDIVFDPTCGTGGFLVAALDKVRKDGGDTDSFKKGNLYGVEQDALMATLAIVNMVFRGDGSSNIKEGDCLKRTIDKKPDKVLMNPPFALKEEKEWQFVDKALEQMNEDGLLFAVLPTTAMSASDDSRGEITWRKEMLKRHTLIAVIKFPEKLFYPNVSKGTYGIVIKAHRPHIFNKDKVLWALLEDGVVRTKTQSVRQIADNMERLLTALKHYITTKTEPDYLPAEMDCSLIASDDRALDLSPEIYLGVDRKEGEFDIHDVYKSIEDGNRLINIKKYKQSDNNCGVFPVLDFFKSLGSGASGRNKNMRKGGMPLVSTSERNNGISAMVNANDCKVIYPKGQITITKNGGGGRAHYHDYSFAANSDVFVGELKPKYNNKNFAIFLCASVNHENWRYNYYRKLSNKKLKYFKIKLPVDKNGEVDIKKIEMLISNVGKTE